MMQRASTPQNPAATWANGRRTTIQITNAASKAPVVASTGARAREVEAAGSSTARTGAPRSAGSPKEPATEPRISSRRTSANARTTARAAAPTRAGHGTSASPMRSGAPSTPTSRKTTNSRALTTAAHDAKRLSFVARAARTAAALAPDSVTARTTPLGRSAPIMAARSAEPPSERVTANSPADVSICSIASNPATVVPTGTATSCVPVPETIVAVARCAATPIPPSFASYEPSSPTIVWIGPATAWRTKCL